MQPLAIASCVLVIPRHMQQRACEVALLLLQRQLQARQDTTSTGRAGCGLPTALLA